MTVLAAEPGNWIDLVNRPRAGSPALFLDRDGTLIENRDYLADPAGVVMIAGAAEAISAFRGSGYAVVVVTNQSGVARGLVSPAQYAAVNRRMLECLEPGGIDAVFACPFHPDGVPPFNGSHRWRKPEPGMLLDAASIFGLDLAQSVMVGDSLSDICAGISAGVGRLIHVATGHGQSERSAVRALREYASGRVELVADIGEVRPVGVPS